MEEVFPGDYCMPLNLEYAFSGPIASNISLRQTKRENTLGPDGN